MNTRRKPKFVASIVALFLLAALLGSTALTAGAETATTSYVAVSAGRWFTCALTTSGGVKCWGQNDGGQLGDGTTTNRNSPVDVVGLTSGVSAITTGWFHTCALTTQGGVKCWGGNGHGEAGNGTIGDHNVPVDVIGLTGNVLAITAGQSHTCALTGERAIKCWGNNADGELGDGTTINRTTPVDVVGMSSDVVYIEAGGFHTCAMRYGSGLKCWGANAGGQLGDGTTIDHITPGNVSGMANGVGGISAGGWHTCARTNLGIKCWGLNNNGQLGVGTTAFYMSSPTDVVGLSNGAEVISAGEYHTCAVSPGGGALCWGWNSDGQLGNGNTVDSNVPVNVVGLGSGVSSISAGGNHSCALMASGGIKCWGWNGYGQLGDGTNIDHLTPVTVLGSSVLDPFSIFLPLLTR
jgi:alpha-tubulin suppressor-like RCC1 family protein